MVIFYIRFCTCQETLAYFFLYLILKIYLNGKCSFLLYETLYKFTLQVCKATEQRSSAQATIQDKVVAYSFFFFQKDFLFNFKPMFVVVVVVVKSMMNFI